MEAIGSTTKPIYIDTDGAAKPGKYQIVEGATLSLGSDGATVTQPLAIFDASTDGKINILKDHVDNTVGGFKTESDINYFQPMYLNKGKLSVLKDSNVGSSDTKPLKMIGGKITAVSAELAPKSMLSTTETWTMEALDGTTTTKKLYIAS